MSTPARSLLLIHDNHKGWYLFDRDLGHVGATVEDPTTPRSEVAATLGLDVLEALPSAVVVSEFQTWPDGAGIDRVYRVTVSAVVAGGQRDATRGGTRYFHTTVRGDASATSHHIGYSHGEAHCTCGWQATVHVWSLASSKAVAERHARRAVER